MYAIIGRYKVRMEETGLVIKHATGIAFELTPEETLGFLDFMKAYQQTLISMRSEDPETQPIVRIMVAHVVKTEKSAKLRATFLLFGCYSFCLCPAAPV